MGGPTLYSPISLGRYILPNRGWASKDDTIQSMLINRLDAGRATVGERRNEARRQHEAPPPRRRHYSIDSEGNVKPASRRYRI